VGKGNNTPASPEVSALPWMCAAVADDDRPEYVILKSNWFPMRVSVPVPVPCLTTKRLFWRKPLRWPREISWSAIAPFAAIPPETPG
jgi:hypothetical protein